MSQRAWDQQRQFYGSEPRRVQQRVPEHKPDRSCCTPRKVRLQTELFERLRGRPYFFTDSYARELAAHEGEVVVAVHTFLGTAGDARYPSSYTVEIGGKAFHLPALYADVVEG